MHPPSEACKQLFRFHPKCRLAWHGREKKCEDELNAGSFALVQLYHISDIGKFDNRKTFMQFWDDPDYFFGPIFDRNGGCTRDWDPLFWIPIYVANLEQFGIPNQEVFSGKFITKVRPWAANQLKVAKRKREDKIKAVREQRNTLLEEMGERWWRDMNQTGQSGPICTIEEKRAACIQMERKRELQERQLEEEFALPGKK